jgi:CheY-like chemotaxis protein/anti-sigma regulatory factor (Ser/Thr protein kinase)
MMSHELRTPFSGILGTVDLLRASDLPKPALAQVGLLERSARALLALLNNMLDFSKIEAGHLRPENIPFDLRLLIEDLRDIQAVVARAKGIGLEVSLQEQVLIGLGDPYRLRQILDNFLSNAIKFTSRGGVRMCIATEGAGDDRRLKVRVEDSGPGLSDDAKAHLFQPFYQADDSTSRRHGGTGLGLAISRGIAQSLGGDVGVESREGEGACFWLDLPFPETDLPPETAERPDQDDGLMKMVALAQIKSILLVDDDEVNRLVIGGMLSKVGHRVSFALDGHQAVREILRYHFDLVIMDMHMPGMDGISATRAIRTLGDQRAHLPIIGLTADAIAENQPTYLAAGLNALLTKPVSAADLLAAVRKVTTPNSP